MGELSRKAHRINGLQTRGQHSTTASDGDAPKRLFTASYFRVCRDTGTAIAPLATPEGEIGATVSGLFTIEGSSTRPKQPPIVPICDNVVAWLGTTGILAALLRRAIEGGSYRVVISLTRTVLWLLSLGIFDKAYAKATAGSTDEHTYIAPDLFTAETPLGTYQGMTDQIVMSRTPGGFRTVLAPRGSSKPEWLPLRS